MPEIPSEGSKPAAPAQDNVCIRELIRRDGMYVQMQVQSQARARVTWVRGQMREEGMPLGMLPWPGPW